MEYYELSLKIRKNVSGKEHIETATCYNNIGLIYDDIGDYNKALEYIKESLNIRKKLLGEKHWATAASYNNIGSIYNNMGDYSILNMVCIMNNI